MKSTGLIRRFDALGRIAVPRELRNVLGVINHSDNVMVEFFVDEDCIIMKRYDTNYDKQK